MPEDSKKNDKKNAKEQRKPRQRNQQGKPEKKPEKTEESKTVPKVTEPQKPVYESPPPEFFKNLKRETDEILKITEEENSKYKKKEIQSNWSKYEVPIESYDEIDEQENLGADYEKLIAAPLSAGGHFQFKHEKSWDMNIGPSPYDKYFEINMEDLNIAVCTIPFYERNGIEQSAFNETDILTMNNRSTRFKQKYYNDKAFSTPETEAQDKILSSLRDTKTDHAREKNIESLNNNLSLEEKCSLPTDITLDISKKPKDIIDNKVIEENNTPSLIKAESRAKSIQTPLENDSSLAEDVENDDFIFSKTAKPVKPNIEVNELPKIRVEERKVSQSDIKKTPSVETKGAAPVEVKVAQSAPIPTVATPPVEPKNPVIESPEDLEKWLDDFLDS